MAEAWIESEGGGDALVLRAGGEWCIAAAASLDRTFGRLTLPPARRVRIDLAAIEALDTVGAWLVLRLERGLAAKGAEVTIENLAVPAPPPPRRRDPFLADGLAFIGAATLDLLRSSVGHLGFLGLVAVTL